MNEDFGRSPFMDEHCAWGKEGVEMARRSEEGTPLGNGRPLELARRTEFAYSPTVPRWFGGVPQGYVREPVGL